MNAFQLFLSVLNRTNNWLTKVPGSLQSPFSTADGFLATFIWPALPFFGSPWEDALPGGLQNVWRFITQPWPQARTTPPLSLICSEWSRGTKSHWGWGGGWNSSEISLKRLTSREVNPPASPWSNFSAAWSSVILNLSEDSSPNLKPPWQALKSSKHTAKRVLSHS